MKILVTGANGFIGKNITSHFTVRDDIELVTFTREDEAITLGDKLDGVDFVLHLAGVNRPEKDDEFQSGNVSLTDSVCEAIAKTKRKIPLLYASSIQAENNNSYGKSKFQAEEVVRSHSLATGNDYYIFRLPNVFGKWCKPNYNSVVATFCHNVVHGLPLNIHDPEAKLSLVYVDDVVKAFEKCIDSECEYSGDVNVEPVYETTVGALADLLHDFSDYRNNLSIGPVGTGFVRALYATYLSYIPPDEFSYSLPSYGDERGVFVEMLKTPVNGQFSFFTAKPGVTRGGHFHHTKNEKFLVIKGRALFKFENIISGERSELITSGERPVVVETIPGWSHDITNIGDDDVVVMLWANEIFDRDQPDTYNRVLWND